MYFTQPLKLQRASPAARKSAYFGQPSGGFFPCSDLRTAACHGPFSLSTSGLGPGADFSFCVFCLSVFIALYCIAKYSAKSSSPF